MPQKFTGRVILILTLLLLAVIVLLPPGSLFDSKVPWKSKINLKPGIDMAGGTRLIYEIKATGDQPTAGNELVEQVMNSLKKRVDPDGVRNLVWRPQSGNRLEIQMPLTGSSDEAKGLRDTYLATQRALDATNLRLGEVRRAIEKNKAEPRQALIKQLAQGSDPLAILMDAMASAYDRIQIAEKDKDFAKQAEAEVQYDNFKRQIEKLNLASGDLESALNAKEETQKKRLGELREEFKGFPARIKAIDEFAAAYKKYLPVRSQLDDAGELKRLLKGSGVLSYHIMVAGQDLDAPLAREMRDRLRPGGKGIAPQANDQMRWFQVDRPEDFTHTNQTVEYNDKFWALAWTTPEKSMVNRAGQSRWTLESASPASDQMGLRAVGFRFDAEGAVRFGELTAANINETLAVLLDEKIISAANINSVISRDGIITRGSGYTDAEFRYLINTLNAGSLPAQLSDQPISEQTVGPTIGKDNLSRGLYSCLIGLVVVTIFLIGYYYFAGVVATFAVFLNMVFILAAMAALDATFTLPGVAGIVLTIGMAVDANVLIFERLREEQQRGLSLRMALRNAYDRAFSAIFDSNVTTAITAGILYVLGSEEVKGFGLTLMLGMFSSLFTALFVTKTIFGLMLDKGNMKKLGSLPLTFPKWDRFLRPSVNWMKLAPWFYTTSILFIGTGLVLFSIRLYQGKLMDIEFASGTSITFDLSNEMSIDEVREAVDKVAKQKEFAEALPAPSVVSVGTKQLTYEVITPNPKGSEVKKAVIAAMGDKLKIERASEFEGSALPIDQARAQNLVVPITDELTIDGVAIEEAYLYQGGVAFILHNMQPPLSDQQIKDRIERQRLQPAVGTPLPYREIGVAMLKSTQAGHPDTAVVMIADPRLSYADDKDKWQSDLSAPLWQLIHDGINRPEELQKVTNFDPQVAASTSLRALVALGLSVLVITAYIWIRFGNLKFGSATVIACVHDTLFTLAAIGYAQFLANTTVGDALLLEPFRINLTLVAAVLAVLGYSMNDTIVVFDRIRENRGKRGDVDTAIINDSINETLSRTLLTSGTTLVTMFVMYIWGGPGVHGFTFVLLGGILVGTYSSVAIAAPMLLLGTAKETSGNPSRKATKASAD